MPTQISERIQIDRMWRDEKRHIAFQTETGLSDKDRNTLDYHERFRAWASVRLDT